MDRDELVAAARELTEVSDKADTRLELLPCVQYSGHMDLGSPYADVVPGPRGRILVCLVQLAQPVTVRALAREAVVSPQATLDIVNGLIVAGLLHERAAGAARLVELNRDHVAAASVVALVEIRGRLADRLRAELDRWTGLAAAWLFGSAARGDGGPGSDIDILLVGEVSLDNVGWDESTARLRENVRRWTGNEVELVEHTRASFASLVKERNSLVGAVRAEGVALTKDSATLLRAVR